MSYFHYSSGVSIVTCETVEEAMRALGELANTGSERGEGRKGGPEKGFG